MSSSAPPLTEDTQFAGLLTPTPGPLCLPPPLPGTFFLQFASWPIHLLCPFPAPFPADIFFMAFLDPYPHDVPMSFLSALRLHKHKAFSITTVCPAPVQSLV